MIFLNNWIKLWENNREERKSTHLRREMMKIQQNLKKYS